MKTIGLNVAVVGASGLVGQEMLSVLADLRFPVAKLIPIASSSSTGKSVVFRRTAIPLVPLTPEAFKNVDLALFSAGAAVSREFAPLAARAGAFVIDNSSAFRMEAHVPLVVPEVNPHDVMMAAEHRLLANPNCSTIQMVVVLSILRHLAPLSRAVASTYQSTSGAGREAIDELLEQSRDLLDKKPIRPKVFPHQIAFNCIPHIDDFESDGFTREEKKMMLETQKILHDDAIRILATAVRVPSIRGHAISLSLEFQTAIDQGEAKQLLARSSSIVMMDDPQENHYPTPVQAAHRDTILVGRLRRDPTVPHGLALWVVADNVRKGAALNAVQIALLLREHGMV